MSGIEVAGLVLGGFPILLNCLDYYRKGFEPLEEWFSFRTHFIAFIDNIRHQMMRYNENMIRLLDPIIGDNESLAKLVRDPTDSRWNDHSLDTLLEQRLSSEFDRFLRIVDRMHEVMLDLNKLLQIEDGQVSWVGPSQHKPWQWHFKRVQISFSKGKHKKVKKLASHNQELQEILGYSERLIPISDRRKASEPVGRLEKLRQHACSVHSALKSQWKCNKSCRSHEAHLSLRAEAVSVSMNFMFIVHGGQGTSSKPITQEVVTQPKEALPPTLSDISRVPQSALLTTVQQTIIEQDTLAKRRPNVIHRLSQRLHAKELSLKGSSGKAGDPNSTSTKKTVRFGSPVPVIAISPPGNSSQARARTARSLNAAPVASPTIGDSSAPLPIADLCFNKKQSSVVIQDNSDRLLELCKPSKGLRMVISERVRLYPLPELLDAYHQATIDLSRQHRFEMATHIASALLQAHRSPWLSAKWSKRDFYFLADMDSQSLRSSHPFVSRNFLSGSDDEEEATTSEIPNFSGNRQASEEDTRACLFTVGVIILELIFGHNIEDCSFRKDYYGKDNKPNDQTDISTARKWAMKVLGDSGADVADVVRRCLDCSFGPKPSFSDVRFRNSVYEGVIKPLAGYSKVWSEVMP
ncbi:uncharacterized protein NECHADRAFT_87584 [Fusarium vanettenii 77-13-4]|uniref:DUF7580 domain-containing protein n=1 Tax=Fusarium vanettenii (strain ATCC MYA-4622 / CBS 123669 / FGSC 9596 / NRRL 45880 / 77-13-4) TaxID=660122 RepID=C7Z2F5_FUSV7|nr:uncharacterized protein NECHADRAFT_87584 [Fusarium vanettenii 77-13-4]EEU41653.1 hypothetical protein NECHADRAFT_87584 [Fusarium vanettenii 77-13-4]